MEDFNVETFIVSFIITWSIGLLPPILIRYAILKHPMAKKPAIGISAFFWFLNIILFTAMGSKSKTHAVLLLIAYISYWILRREKKSSASRSDSAISVTVSPTSQTTNKPMQSNVDDLLNSDDIKEISSNRSILKTDTEKMSAGAFVASHNILLKNSMMVIIGIAIAIVVIVGIFVWPTRYRYDHMTHEKNIYPIRIDRLTGRTEVFYGEWISTGESTPAPEAEDLPLSALNKLTGQASITSYGWINCDIYNGSDRILSEVTVVVTVKKINGAEILSRKYLLYGSGAPLTSSKFHTGLGFELKKGETFSWGIVGAKGRKKS